MKNLRIPVACGSVLLTFAGLAMNAWNMAESHAVRPIIVLRSTALARQQEALLLARIHHGFFLSTREVQREETAALIARLRNTRAFLIKNPITNLEETLILERSLAGHEHIFLAETGKARLITEAIIRRDEERARLSEQIALRQLIF